MASCECIREAHDGCAGELAMSVASKLVREACKACNANRIYNPGYMDQLARIMKDDVWWQKNGYSTRDDMLRHYIEPVLTNIWTLRNSATSADRALTMRGLMQVGERVNARQKSLQ